MFVLRLPRHAPCWQGLLALTVAVTAVHVWLLVPDRTFIPSPPVWQVRWIVFPRPVQVATAPTADTPQTAPKPAPLRAPTPTRPHVPVLPRPEPLLRRAHAHIPGRASVAATDTAATGAADTLSDHATDGVFMPVPVRLPPAARLRYQVTGARHGEPITGESTLIWSPDGASYRAAWVLDSPQLGQRSQTSEGALQAGGLAPERYGERQRSERAAHFDPAGGRVRFSANTPDAPWQPGMQDRLSALLQLAALLAAAPQRYPAGSVIGLPTAGVRDAADARWQVESDKTLDIAGQAVPCVKLRRDPVGPYDSRTDLWLARNRNYLPVRLLTTRFNGDTVNETLYSTPDQN
ncbi:MAG: DUF3108 domain-containing protein [Burkholderiaceae bacterium]|nr:DUF3108 domain-containing protein [Burkholderiaceae bacterium]